MLSDDVTLSTPCPAPADLQADVAGAVQGLHSAGAHECADDRVNPGGIPDIVYLRRNLSLALWAWRSISSSTSGRHCWAGSMRTRGLDGCARVAVAWGRLSTLDRRAKNGVNLALPPDALHIPRYRFLALTHNGVRRRTRSSFPLVRLTVRHPIPRHPSRPVVELT